MPRARRTCSVPYCDNVSSKTVTLHELPKQSDTRQQWIDYLASKGGSSSESELGKQSVICTAHFSKDSVLSHNSDSCDIDLIIELHVLSNGSATYTVAITAFCCYYLTEIFDPKA